MTPFSRSLGSLLMWALILGLCAAGCDDEITKNSFVPDDVRGDFGVDTNRLGHGSARHDGARARGLLSPDPRRRGV